MNSQILEVVTDITGLTSTSDPILLACFGFFFFIIMIDCISGLVTSLCGCLRGVK